MRFPARLIAAALTALAILPATGASVAADPATIPDRPNIVVFYLDDVAMHDARLWNDPARTPNIYEQFIAHGINLDHAIGERDRFNGFFQGDFDDLGLSQDLGEMPESLLGGMEQAGPRGLVPGSQVMGCFGGQ